MKRVLSITLAALFILLSSANADFIPLSDASLSDSTTTWTLDETANGVTVTLNFPGISTTETILAGMNYQQLEVKGCGLKAEDGEPYMPFKGLFIEVPHGVTVTVDEVKQVNIIIDGKYDIYPKQPAQPECGDDFQLTPVISEKAYSHNGLFPESKAILASDSIIRGRRVVFLEVSPLQYNPVTGNLLASPEVTVNVSWTGNLDMAAETRKIELASPAFENQAAQLIANYHPVQSKNGFDSREGADYLILCADMFADEMVPFSEWKTLKGYRTSIKTLSDAGGTSEAAIKTFLQTVYDTWNPVPTYVLLVGDAPQLTPAHENGYPGNFITDLPYSCLDGSDYFADVFMGRFAVENETECTTVVNKVLGYDRNPSAGTWYNGFLVAADLQADSSPSCTAQRWFFETAFLIKDYLEDTIGMDIYSAACTSSSGCTQYHPRADSYPHRPTVPDPMPSAWVDTLTSHSQATTNVYNAFASGVSLIQHRDHGEETGWSSPPFHVSDVNNLTNGNMLPVVNSLNCLTGAFSYGSDCFAEALQIKSGGGAIGVIAATESSMSGYNDLIAHGMFTCYYPDYDSSHTTNIYNHSKRLGEVMNYGKYYMYEYEGSSATYTQYEFQLFHWFGDPEMQIRNTVPVPADVDVPISIPAGSYSVSINCGDEGAMIALSQEGNILGVGIASGGVCIINLDSAITPGIDITMVVTGFGLQPLETNVLSEAVSCGSVNIVENTVNCSTEIHVNLMDADLNLSPSVLDEVTINVFSDTSTAGYDLTLTEIDVDLGVFEGTIQLFSAGGTGNLQVADGDTITAFYHDDNCDGTPQDNYDYAESDCDGPVISGIAVSDISIDRATVSWTTSEPATTVLTYGDSNPPTTILEDAALKTTHELVLDGLDDCTLYNFSIACTDESGNETLDDNSGSYYHFTTYEQVVLLDVNMDADPGWTYNGQWAWGVPQGNDGDPSGGYTGSNVVGYNLSGAYPNNMAETACITQSFDCSSAGEVFLSFYKWLGVESSSYDHASIDVSNNGGTSWNNIWEHTAGSVSGGSWEFVEYDISSYAVGYSNVEVRWIMGTSDSSVVYCGWNIDDVIVSYTTECSSAPTPTPTSECLNNGDVNLDGFVTAGDAQLAFQIALGSYTPTYLEECAADCNGDSDVTAGDAQGVFLVALGGASCADPMTSF